MYLAMAIGVFHLVKPPTMLRFVYSTRSGKFKLMHYPIEDDGQLSTLGLLERLLGIYEHII
jgi:hypothetical protein